MKMKKRLISIAMAAVMAVGSIPAAGALLDGFNNTRTYSDQFTDVPSTAWYYNSVKSAYELGITAGTSASKFSPDQNLTTDQRAFMRHTITMKSLKCKIRRAG